MPTDYSIGCGIDFKRYDAHWDENERPTEWTLLLSSCICDSIADQAWLTRLVALHAWVFIWFFIWVNFFAIWLDACAFLFLSLNKTNSHDKIISNTHTHTWLNYYNIKATLRRTVYTTIDNSNDNVAHWMCLYRRTCSGDNSHSHTNTRTKCG